MAGPADSGAGNDADPEQPPSRSSPLPRPAVQYRQAHSFDEQQGVGPQTCGAQGDVASHDVSDVASDDVHDMTSLSIDVVYMAGDWSAFGSAEDLIVAVAKVVSAHPDLCSFMPATAALALGDDVHVRSLNLQFRGINRPTNVLSFPASISPPVAPVAADAPGAAHEEPGFLGDIILAQQTIAREAAEQGKPPAHHLQHLVLHGLLHLIGFDHQTEAEAAEMEALEIELLAALAIANPYASAATISAATTITPTTGKV